MDIKKEIAIVGVGCRFPGADNLNEYWRVLEKGENHVTDIPRGRWNNDAFYSEDKDAPGKIYVKKAGLLKRYETEFIDRNLLYKTEMFSYDDIASI